MIVVKNATATGRKSINKEQGCRYETKEKERIEFLPQRKEDFK